MNRTGTYALASIFLAAGLASAGETRLLSDFAPEGSWKVSRWSKAKARIAVRPESPPQLAGKAPARALGVKVRFPGGGGFHFVNLLPNDANEPIDRRVLGGHVWLKGAGTRHYVLALFRDAKGDEHKIDLGRLDSRRWQKRTFAIPRNWPQPLTLKGITFHDWGVADPADVTAYLARLTVEVDPKAKVPADPDAAGKRVYKPLPRVKLPGAERVYSDMNLPGEWRPSPWNRARGKLDVVADFPEEVGTDDGEMRRSLELSLTFPDGFGFYGLTPPADETIPYHVHGLQLWVKGTETRHTLELRFTTADGKEVKLSPKPSSMDFYGWQQVTARVPRGWSQPLTLTGITIHNHAIRRAAEISLRLTRLTVSIDPKKHLGDLDDLHATDDDW